jgi:hypothetical protein
MMSHFKNYQRGNPLSDDFMPVCLRNYGQPDALQSPLLMELAANHGRTVESLTKEEYCAAHLASLGEAAIREHERTADSNTLRWFVNYQDLPHKIWEKVLPDLIGPLTAKQIQRMHIISQYYSKGRGPKAGLHWQEDSTLKQGTAPAAVKQAASTFLEPTYRKLEIIRNRLENH